MPDDRVQDAEGIVVARTVGLRSYRRMHLGTKLLEAGITHMLFLGNERHSMRDGPTIDETNDWSAYLAENGRGAD